MTPAPSPALATSPPPPPPPPTAEVDHLVVAAASLAQGFAWCEATLGVVPGPGGQHPLFGTHNRLLRIDSAAFPQAYLEIIAIDPEAAPRKPRPRWFGLDESALQRRLAERGPQLLHVVARTGALDAQLAALRALGVDAGDALAASRKIGENGESGGSGGRGEKLLRWRIAVRPDGALLHGGALPTLIEWQGIHPAQAMAASPVALREVSLAGLPPRVATALGLGAVHFVAQSLPGLRARFDTPRGPVTLETA